MKQNIKLIILGFIPALLANLTIWILDNRSDLFGAESLFIKICYVLIIVISLYFLMSIRKLLKIYFNPKRYFREEFSLIAMSSCLWLSIILALSYLLKLMPWHICQNIFNYFTNKATSTIQVTIFQYLVVFLLLLLIFSLVSQIYQNWNGKKSTNQQKKEQNSQNNSFITEGINELLRIIKRDPSLEVYSGEKFNRSQNDIEPPQDLISKAWQDQARELVHLSSSSYAFDLKSDWNNTEKCWVGENIDTKQVVVLYPVQTQLSSSKLRELENTAQNIANRKEKELGEIIIAFQKTSDRLATPDPSSDLMRFETEQSLLDNLVNFRDYYNDIIKRVETDKLSEADWTLKDVYVPSNFIGSDDTKSSQTIEEYLQEWLNEPSNKQIALLGEYGQGKSSAALMFVYHMITLAKPAFLTN